MTPQHLQGLSPKIVGHRNATAFFDFHCDERGYIPTAVGQVFGSRGWSLLPDTLKLRVTHLETFFVLVLLAHSPELEVLRVSI